MLYLVETSRVVTICYVSDWGIYFFNMPYSEYICGQ
jgi:hypothetical protein